MTLEFFETLLEYIVEIGILVFEFMGVFVILVSGIYGFWLYLRRSPKTKLALARGLSQGLQFKLGGEILRTVIVHDLSEIVLIGGIIALRAALTLLIHWEIKQEEEEERNREEEEEEELEKKAEAEKEAEAAREAKEAKEAELAKEEELAKETAAVREAEAVKEAEFAREVEMAKEAEAQGETKAAKETK